jgi:hypothetical protein
MGADDGISRDGSGRDRSAQVSYETRHAFRLIQGGEGEKFHVRCSRLSVL